jgi:HEAT repeat protein
MRDPFLKQEYAILRTDPNGPYNMQTEFSLVLGNPFTHNPAMKQPPRILFFITAAILLLTFGWFVSGTREPSYQGRTLTEWLHAAYGTYPEADSEEVRAIHHIGSNAIPTLLAYAAAAQDSPLKKCILNWRNAHPRFRLPVSSQFEKETLAETGFAVLGTDGKPAVPELVRLLRDNDSGVWTTAAWCLASIGPAAEPAVPDLIKVFERENNAGYAPLAAAYALGQIGPSAQAAIPSLKAGLTNNSLPCRIYSQAALINIHAISISPLIEQLKDTKNAQWGATWAVVRMCGTNAVPTVPLFISWLNTTNDILQANCLSALGWLHQEPDVCIPVIVPFLNSKSDDLRQDAINALCRFGKAAKPAVPALLRCLDDIQYEVRKSATNALRDIDPEAAAKAGIK